MDQNYYEFLEVEPSASLHDIQEAYVRAKKMYSPNSPALYSMFSEGEVRQLLKLVEEAYLILSNEARRVNYDRDLQKKSLPNQSLTSLDQIPEGFANSKLSVYEIRPEMEEQILNESVLDGNFIQRIRMYKNINLDQISHETCIKRNYLVAIESNDFEALPAAVFVRGFVVQISKILGLNHEKVTNMYMKYFKKSCVGED